MGGDVDGGSEDRGGRGGTAAVEAERAFAELAGDAGGAGVQDGRVDGRGAAGDLGDGADGRVVAAEVDGGQAVSGEDEADDLAVDLAVVAPFTVLGTVDGRHGGDGQLATARAAERVGVPDGQALRGGSEPVGAAGGGEQQRGGRREGAAAVVEVVGVVVVADQDQVDVGEPVLGDGRALGLGQVAVRARVVERRVGDDAESAEVEDGGGPADDHGPAFVARKGGERCHAAAAPWTSRAGPGRPVPCSRA
ncbi:hypothetical protein GCM10010524_00590 [Streptomyces mexicanus]